MYCSPIDLIAYANRAKLIGQLASSDYGDIVEPQAVLDYFFNGTFAPEDEQALRLLSSRVEQAIDNATGEINGYTALFAHVTLPSQTLKSACMDIALFRLFENLDEDNVIRLTAEKWVGYFDKIATGKMPINADDETAVTGSAETVGDAVIFTGDFLRGY